MPHSAIHPPAALGSVRRAPAPTASYHPLGCHRPASPTRPSSTSSPNVLVFGCGYRRIADATCSATTRATNGRWPGRRSGRRPALRCAGCGGCAAGRCAVSRKLHLGPDRPAFALGASTGVAGQPALRRDALRDMLNGDNRAHDRGDDSDPVCAPTSRHSPSAGRRLHVALVRATSSPPAGGRPVAHERRTRLARDDGYPLNS